MERRERVGHLLRDAETNISLALRAFTNGLRDDEARQLAKETRKKLKQAIEALDGID